MPHRVQLRRIAGWRMPPNCVKVDRSTRWGNPLRVRPGYSAEQAVADYRSWIKGGGTGLVAPEAVPPTLLEIRQQLADKNLACWCPLGQPCHADVLLELANSLDAPVLSHTLK